MDTLANGVSLYFHIPFCTKKCDYCHFYVLPDKAPLKESFMVGLEKEWLFQLPHLLDKKVASIYFGGGTPYLLGASAIGQILDWVKRSLSFVEEEIEITLEANPENVDFDSMCAYRNAGINRISIGVQSLDNTLLHSLGRLHSANKSLEAIDIAKRAGINNISIDLMYDLPRQTLDTWQKSLQQIKTLPITHLSLYNLTIEPHTVFFKYRNSLAPLIPDEETSLEMYQMAVTELQSAGLQQYEISAFSKENHFARHNTGYWTGRQFLGFGPSAFSFWEGRRFRNIANLSKYLSRLHEGSTPIDFEEKLEPDAQQRELLTIGLRILEGVDLHELQKSRSLGHETLASLNKLVSDGYLSSKGKCVKLTPKGILFYDNVASDLI
ncbi:MAG: radical SAM family heme chaperone HemW [Parachlamydiaceae bacterium]|nr:radical SAM family heme chaperone HemW [Parachlamydiaceae bacterium]